MGFEAENIRDWQGRSVVDPTGGKIGSLEAIYVDTVSDEPVFATVVVGMVGRRRLAFVPLTGATVAPDHVRVTVAKDLAKHAPSIDTDGELAAEDEPAVFEHYGLPAAVGRAPHAASPGAERSDDGERVQHRARRALAILSGSATNRNSYTRSAASSLQVEALQEVDRAARSAAGCAPAAGWRARRGRGRAAPRRSRCRCPRRPRPRSSSQRGGRQVRARVSVCWAIALGVRPQAHVAGADEHDVASSRISTPWRAATAASSSASTELARGQAVHARGGPATSSSTPAGEERRQLGGVAAPSGRSPRGARRRWRRRTSGRPRRSVMWASASMCAPECARRAEQLGHAAQPDVVAAGAHRFSAPTRSPRGRAVGHHLERRVAGEQRHAGEPGHRQRVLAARRARGQRPAPRSDARAAARPRAPPLAGRPRSPWPSRAATVPRRAPASSAARRSTPRAAAARRSTALAIAVGATSRPPSPAPFTPYSVNGEGVSRCSTTISGTSCRLGQQVLRATSACPACRRRGSRTPPSAPRRCPARCRRPPGPRPAPGSSPCRSRSPRST